MKGFLFPDRRNDNLIFATTTKVWSVSDDAPGPSCHELDVDDAGGRNPSIVLYWPQTNYVYVGGGDGKLWQLDFSATTRATPSSRSPLDPGRRHGPDRGAVARHRRRAPDGSLVVGSESGVLYGVEVPFP